MRSFLVVLTGVMLLAGHAAQAKVDITVDKDNQVMTVAVDGVARYHWPVSTGIPSRETPNGSFRAFRMEADHFSKEFDDAPMPHSIFFTKIGHAIHGTDSEGRLGTPASHGCVRLSKANATTLYALVQEQGVLNTNVTLTGSAAVALARNPRGTAVARRAPQTYDEQVASTAGQPVQIAPQAYGDSQAQVYGGQAYDRQTYGGQTYGGQTYGNPANSGQPQVYGSRTFADRQVVQPRADDGYIYPADGSSDQPMYPAPRSSRRAYEAQAYQQPPARYDTNQGYGQRAPGYYAQPERQYYQPRGYYDQN